MRQRNRAAPQGGEAQLPDRSLHAHDAQGDHRVPAAVPEPPASTVFGIIVFGIEALLNLITPVNFLNRIFFAGKKKKVS